MAGDGGRRERLAWFASRWSAYAGSERAEAQTFLNELFECYGTRRSDVATFETPQAGGFVDLMWPGRCIVEMKRPSEAGRLERHRAQALDYWRRSSRPGDGVPAARYVVLCAFSRLEVWQPGDYPEAPRAVLDLVALPERAEALAFLAGEAPAFVADRGALTREAVAKLSELYDALRDRRAADRDVLRDFLLQSVWCMFAEDLAVLPGHLFTRLVDDLRRDPGRSSLDELGGLFAWLNDPAAARPPQGRYRGVPYANGGLFAAVARVHLEPPELDLLREACAFGWRGVEPQIFGSLMQGCLGREKQWALGAHYTHEADIQKVVQPTIVAPWRERIEALDTYAEAARAHRDLMGYRVLDPACGSGNFLYVAYRELRRLEARLRARRAELRRAAGLPEREPDPGFFPLANMLGVEIEAFAVALARVTLWIGHKLASDELGLHEPTLPLVDLSGIRQGDALRAPWPPADAIIGNPPYHGSQQLRGELGDDYVEWLKGTFGCGVKDYCVYWFRRASDHLAPEGRAGLVGTNSISQNRARSAGLDYVVANGGVIVDAVSRQAWPGEAVVNVSIVSWVKAPATPPAAFRLDGVEVAGITSSLRPLGDGVAGAGRLAASARRAFQGPIPVGAGFVLEGGEAEALLVRPEADYAEVVRPYLIGEDIADDPEQRPRRWIVDFALRTLEEAEAWPAALAIVRAKVKPEREKNRDRRFRDEWWRHGRPRPGMRRAIAGLERFVAANAQGKRILFVWCDARVCPSNLTNVFAFDDDYAMGVLSSRAHGEWARAQSSTLRVDLRYTPTSAFETFPWPPSPTDAARRAVAEAAAEMLARRGELCLVQGIGLTALYNRVDEGAFADLRRLHERLDEAVAAAYGWPRSAARDADEAKRRLLDLNRRVLAGAVPYEPY